MSSQHVRIPSTTHSRTTSQATVPSTPTNSRLASSQTLHSSPHYTTTRRHSLYGVEDRVIIDPGSRIWKVGFSGEGKPRDVFCNGSEGEMWNLNRTQDPNERNEEERLLVIKMETSLRRVFHDSLLTDPKARKVIVVEHPLLPIYLKDIIARLLFENLQVPSVSFASSHLLSLISVGRITGLVLDCGHLESVVLPIFAARPLYPLIKTTPLAGKALTSHLRSLLLLFATYLPSPTSLSAAVNIPASSRSTRVPQQILTDSLVEDIKTRCCFVGDIIQQSRDDESNEDIDMDIPPPSSDATTTTQSESGFSSQNPPESSSEFSVARGVYTLDMHRPSQRGEEGGQALASLYSKHSTATDLHISVIPPSNQQTGTGNATLIVPGWIRERCTEVLFSGGDVDESSVAEVILDSLLRIPIDLRKTMISNILVAGGTAMIPGFLPRLHAEIVRCLTPPVQPSPRHYDKYATLRTLVPYIAILNNPNPPPPSEMSTQASRNAGRAPAFAPSVMAWVGGSLSGALKTGGAEITREKWDTNQSRMDDEDNEGTGAIEVDQFILPDWTRAELPVGAPPVIRIREATVGA